MDKDKMVKEIERLHEIIDEILFRVDMVDEDMISLKDLKNHLYKNNLLNVATEDGIDEYVKYHKINYYEEMSDKIIEEVF